jgi:hypothetical protein
MSSSPDVLSSPRTARARRIGLVAALVVAPWLLVLATGAGLLALSHGGNDSTGVGSLAVAAAHPGLYRLAMVLAMLGSLLMVPAVIGVMRLIGYRAARLGLIGGVVTAAAYICYFAMNSGDRFQLAMIARGDTGAEFGHVLDTSQNGASVLWYFLLFAVGSLVGTFMLGLALRRSRVVPWWAAASVMAWSVLKAPEFLGLRVAEIVGSVLLAIGFAVAARALSRVPLAVAAQQQIGENGAYPAVVALGVDQA